MHLLPAATQLLPNSRLAAAGRHGSSVHKYRVEISLVDSSSLTMVVCSFNKPLMLSLACSLTSRPVESAFLVSLLIPFVSCLESYLTTKSEQGFSVLLVKCP